MLRKIFPDLIKDFIKQARTKPHKGIEKYGLSKNQVYPSGTNFNKHFKMDLQKQFKSLNFTKKTKVSSIGTCFAEEFSKFLAEFGGSYIYKEKNKYRSSVNWGRVYTIPNFTQTVEYSLTDKIPLIVEKCEKGYFDPSENPYLDSSKKGHFDPLEKCYFDPLRDRSCGFFDSLDEAKEKILQHRAISKEVFKNSEIIVITIGQNECWMDREKGFVWGIMPPLDIYKSKKERFFIESPSIENNILSLGNSLKLIKKANDKVKFIITVSPVPSGATFTDANVINRSFLNKCILRYVVNHIVEKSEDQNVYYYPSFEMVLCDNPKSFIFDNRHVRKETVQNIFDIFGAIIKE